MERADNKILDFEKFISTFMINGGKSFEYRRAKVQVYPLSIAQSRIDPPTPLVRATYSFILLFVKGGGRQQIDNDFFELRANDILFVREGHLNAILEIHPDTEGFFIYIDNSVLQRIFESEMLLNRITFNPKNSTTEDKMINFHNLCELIRAQEGMSPNKQNIQVALLKGLLLMITENWQQTRLKVDRISEIVFRFKQEVFLHFKKERKVQFYADRLSVSQNYLNRCVQSITNKSPKQYIIEMVINHSKTLFQNPSNNVSQVAFHLNFDDPAHFSRLFKKISKQTPTAYIQSLRYDLYK